jgi:glutathione peroxidase
MRAWPRTFALLGFSALTLLHLPADPPRPPAANAPPSPAVTTPPSNPVTTPAAPSLYHFTVNSLDGKPVDLAQYQGHVVLVVNTASKSGYVSQYAGLEKLYQDYKAQGFVVLAFPSNDFGGQEPGSPKEIATLCSTRFNVTFPLFEKTKTRGEGQSPIYAFLTTGHAPPQWNFHKYLVDKTGQVIKEFPSQVPPESQDIRSAIEAALKH